MTNDWLIPLISGLSGVGGAAVGAGVALVIHRREARAAEKGEHRAALVGLWTAANSFALVWQSYGSTLPTRQNWFTHARHGLRLGGLAPLILQRLWLVTDSVWEATGRFRTVAVADELQALNQLEEVLASWEIGEPLPDSWGAAIRRLREIVEGEGRS